MGYIEVDFCIFVCWGWLVGEWFLDVGEVLKFILVFIVCFFGKNLLFDCCEFWLMIELWGELVVLVVLWGFCIFSLVIFRGVMYLNIFVIVVVIWYLVMDLVE